MASPARGAALASRQSAVVKGVATGARSAKLVASGAIVAGLAYSRASAREMSIMSILSILSITSIHSKNSEMLLE